MGNLAIRLAIPKGRMQEGIVRLLSDAGITLKADARAYRPRMNLPGFEVKFLKPQSIVEMIDLGSRDIGFAGADWAAELKVNLVELLNTHLDPVRLIAAAPSSLLDQGKLPKKRLIIASEYEHITRRWIAEKNLDAIFIRSYGATEVFPPEDADCIVDNTSTGATLTANGLEIVDELMQSSTRLFAHPRALDNPERRAAIERFVLVVRSVMEARTRVMLEVNVTAVCLQAVVSVLPGMGEPTVAPLHANKGFAVKAAVPRDLLPQLIPDIKSKGGTDIVVSPISQIIH